MSNDSALPVAGDDAALYNIGVVARMTGIPVATLRVWERRYGFPVAERTPGRHRIFSDREIARLRWVKERIDAGMQTGQAIRALEHRERQQADQENTTKGPGRDAVAPELLGSDPTSGPALESLQTRFTQALLTHELPAAERLLGDALAVFSVEDILLGIIRPAMVTIGEGWAKGKVSVASEHLASQFVRQRLLAWLASGSGNTRRVAPTVLATAPDDWHELSLLMIGILLQRRRWPTHYLGAAVPLPDLADFVRHVEPAAVVLVAMAEPGARALAGLSEAMPEVAVRGRPAICYAGRAFVLQPELRDAVPGVYLGSTLEEGLERLERLLFEVTGATA